MTGDRSARDGGVSITSSVDVSSATLISVHSGVDSVSVELDSSCVIHPFYVHKMDSGPVRLMTIAHAFNYRVAVLRDGVKSALRVGRSRKAERCFMINADIPWGQQVAVMFQIVSTLMADVPGFALVMMELRGMQPHIQLMDDTWGHDGKCVEACECLLSDRTEAFVHCLIPPLLPSGPIPDPGSIDSTMEPAGFTFRDDWISSSSFIHNIYKQIHIHINDKFAQYNTLIVKLDNMKYVQVCICCKVLYGQ